MSASVRLAAAVTAVAVLGLLGGAAQGGYTDIALTNPGFETGDATGWFGGPYTGLHASYPIPNNTSEDLGTTFGYAFNSGTGNGGYQTVSETFAADTCYFFTGLTGKYDSSGSSFFDIGYVTTPGDAATFVSLSSGVQSCTGRLAETPAYGWNLRQGVYHTTASSGPEIGQNITVRFTGIENKAAATWVDNFRLVKGAPKQRIAYTAFQEATLDSDSYTPGPGAQELGFTSAGVVDVIAGGWYAVKDDGTGNKRFEITNKDSTSGGTTLGWVDVSRHEQVRCNVKFAMRNATGLDYEDAAHGSGTADDIRFVLEMNDGTTTTYKDLFDSFDGPDAYTSGSSGWHAGGDINGAGSSGGIGLNMGQNYYFSAEIPDNIQQVRLMFNGSNRQSGNSERFYVDDIEFWGVLAYANLTINKFFDCDQDGTYDVSDADKMLSGWEFEVRDPNGDLVGTYTTDGSGQIVLTDMTPGDYTITETVKNDHVVTGALGNPRIVTVSGDTEAWFGNWLVADINQDGIVDSQDFSILKARFGLSPALWTDGNINLDSLVDSQDFSILKANFGKGVAPGSPGGSPVPEPATMLLLGIGAAALIRRNRKASA